LVYSVKEYTPLGKNFYFSLEKGVLGDVSWGKNINSSVPDTRSKFDGYSLTAYLTPAIGYKLTNRLIASISLNDIVELGYNHQKDENTVSGVTTVTKTNGFSLGSSLATGPIGNLGFTLGWKIN
jgi:hypothetical protein